MTIPSKGDITMHTGLAVPDPSRVRFNGFDRRFVAVAAIYLALYVALDWLSYVRPLFKLEITPWNPQAGLSLALLLLCGPRWFPLMTLAVLLTGLFVHAPAVPTWLFVVGAVWIGIAYGGLAALLGRLQLVRPIGSAIAAARMTGVVAVGTFAVAAGYIGIFVAGGELTRADVLQGIARYWIGDLNGVLALAPLLIWAVHSRRHIGMLRHRHWEILAQLCSIALLLWIVFKLPAADQLRFFYLLFVPIVWIALRWSWPGAMMAVLGIQIGLIAIAEAKIPTARFIDVQFLMLTLTLTALLLGAVVAERASMLREVAIREAEQRTLLAMAPDAVLAVDDSGTIGVANAAASRLFGKPVKGHEAVAVATLLPGLHLDGAAGRTSLEGRRDGGGTFPAEIAWARLDAPSNQRFLVIVRDATERRQAEEELRARDAALERAMRFAVAGELASALAHELNQPITALVSYLRASEILAARGSDDDARLKSTLGKAVHEAIRASTVLRRLRDFYRGDALKHEPIDVPALCSAVASAFQERLRRAEASLQVRVDASMPRLLGDDTQLEIILHNLIANALDAVSNGTEPRRQIELHGSYVDGCIILRVEDTGPGVLGNLTRRLFDPFVTSKPDGMGLGLAISRSLVRVRGGELSYARSASLGGAAFTIRLPLESSPGTLSI